MLEWLKDWSPLTGWFVIVGGGAKLVISAKNRWKLPWSSMTLLVGIVMILIIAVGYLVLRPPSYEIEATVAFDNQRLEFGSAGSDSPEFGQRRDRGFCGEVELPNGSHEFRLLMGEASPSSDSWLTILIYEPKNGRSIFAGAEGDTTAYQVRISGRLGDKGFFPEQVPGKVHIRSGMSGGAIEFYVKPTSTLLVRFACRAPRRVAANP